MESQKIIARVRAEHERWKQQIGPADPYIDKLTIGIHEVLQAHFLLAEYFATQGEGLGGLGQKILTYFTPLYLGNLYSTEVGRSGIIELMCAQRLCMD